MQDMYDRMGTAEDTAAEMNAAIRQTSEYLESEVKAVMRGMQSFGISEAEARRILNAAGNETALQSLRAAANRVADPAKREALLNAINSAGAYRCRITRIEALNKDVVKQCRELYKTENRAVTSALRNVAEESYYREIFSIQKGTGLGFSFSQFSQRDVERILRSNWAGGNYSQRIWRDINGMTARLKQELLVSMLTGRSGEKTARIFREQFGVNAFCARRIVRTESAYVANAAQAQAYDEAGIERYRFIATLDSRTCECCGALDGKVFDLAKAKAGTNYPPMHPFCRSTTIADFGDEEFSQLERRAKDKDGKTVKVPAGMTYEQWKELYVPNAGQKTLDKSAGSGIIKARRLAQEKKFNYRDYDEVIDEKSVDDLKTFVADKMGISHISGIDKLKNGRQAHELLSKVEELSEQYGKRFTRLSLFDYGDERTAAETVGRELRLNVQYLNRPGAFQAVLDEWNESGRIPKGCNNIAYVAKHEYSHLLTQDIIDEPHSKIVSAVRRALKDGCETVSENGNYDCHEFVADLLSAKTLTKSQRKLKDAIMKILK